MHVIGSSQVSCCVSVSYIAASTSAWRVKIEQVYCALAGACRALTASHPCHQRAMQHPQTSWCIACWPACSTSSGTTWSTHRWGRLPCLM